jgi:hypothetical protein
MPSHCALLLQGGLLALALASPIGVPAQADVVVYGDSAAAVTSAVQVARMGKTVLLVSPSKHIGAFGVEGLGGTDINNHWFRNDVAVGGIAREFYDSIRSHYGRDTGYRFESHVAEQVFESMLRHPAITVVRGKRLREPLSSSVEWRSPGKVLQSIRTEDGSTYEGSVFIDATIEGDLLAAAGVTPSSAASRIPGTERLRTAFELKARTRNSPFVSIRIRSPVILRVA